MSHYYFGNHHRHRQRFIHRARSTFITIGVLLILIAAGVIVDVIFLQKDSEKVTDSTVETKAVFLPSTQVIRTAYFQFQAAQTWSLVAGESTATKFVYRNFNKNLVLQELDILVNTPPPVNAWATHVLPVKAVSTGLELKEVSDHCGKGMPSKAIQPNPKLIIFADVQVLCNPSSDDFTVQVGELKGNDTALKLIRPDKTVATYFMQFKDVTVNPNAKELVSILQSFQTR